MTQSEMCELMSVHGFYHFLSQQTHLPAATVMKIYLLGRPWGVWPADLEVGVEAEAAGTDIFTYLAALQPLVDLDRQAKEAQLAAYEIALAREEIAGVPSTIRRQVEQAATLTAEREQTICSILHALYDYRQRIGELAVQKMIQNRTAAIAELQKGIAAAIEHRRDQGDHGPSTDSSA